MEICDPWNFVPNELLDHEYQRPTQPIFSTKCQQLQGAQKQDLTRSGSRISSVQKANQLSTYQYRTAVLETYFQFQ